MQKGVAFMHPRVKKDAPVFSLWFREELRKRGWNGKMAAEKIGVQPGTISKWRKRKTPPEMKGLTAIGRAFEVPTEDILVAAGFDVHPSATDADREGRRLALLAAMPRFAEIMDRVARMEPAKQDAYLSVIESMLPPTENQSNRQHHPDRHPG